MRKMFLAVALLLAAMAAVAQEHGHDMASMVMDETPEQHLARLREYVNAHSVHGPVIPQPDAVTAAANVAVTITAKSFSFSPASFTVNQGDVVTLTLTVPANDASRVGHGLLMSTYFETDPLETRTGGTISRTFTATTAGSFIFICSISDCGTGHTSMLGQMNVTKATVAPPAVSGISPISGATAGGTAVTINGSGFSTGARVTFGGVAATNVVVTSSTTITATAPAHAAGKVDIVVTNSDNQSGTLAQAFTYANTPSITSITPATGPTPGGTLFTIAGSNFQTGATVTIGGVAATNVTVVDANTITARTPRGPATEQLKTDVVVRNPDGTSVTSTGGFTYTVPPLAVLSVTPGIALPLGTAGAGPTIVTIFGNGFTSALPATVSVGGIAATGVQIVDAVTLRATFAARPAGTSDVAVTIGGSTATLKNGFSWQNAPPRHRAGRH